MKTFYKLSAGMLALIMSIVTCACGSSDEQEPEPEPAPALDTSYAGTTVTAPINDPDNTYTSTIGTYRFSIDEKSQTATLYIKNANFLQGMPQLGEMAFPGISYQVTHADASNPASTIAKINFSCDALTPEIAGRPFPAFPISALNATMNPGKSLVVSFICTYRGTPYNVTFAGEPQK